MYLPTSITVFCRRTCFPIESERTSSDHNLISYNCALERPATFAWISQEYLRTTPKGIEKFENLVKNQDWTPVSNCGTADEKAEALNRILNEHLSNCFEWKRIRKRSTESPWITEGLRNQIKKRRNIFKCEGRSTRWKRIDKSIKKTLEIRQSKYFEKESDRLKSLGRPSSWYSLLSKMNDLDAPKQWSINDLEPDTDIKTLANNLAKHFTSITNQASELLPGDIPESKANNVLIPQVLEEEVARRIKKYKKPSSSVPGDLPKVLVNSLYKELAIPLTNIYNKCLSSTTWPRIWKNETVIPIPKTQTPTSYNDIRPISMSPLWSKILETIVADQTIAETFNNWQRNQHGGIKGSSTDHVIVEVWDKILRSLDKSTDNKAVVFTALDFSKSFSRCSYQQILQSYADVGASKWLLYMHAAFLRDRTMSVRIGTMMSDKLAVTGGAVQGSVLGVLDHNVVLNDLDKDLPDSIYLAKYVDDLTLVETVSNTVTTSIDNSGNRQLHSIKPADSQQAFNMIKRRAEAKGLEINSKKTQILSVSSAYYDTKAELSTNEAQNEIVSADNELKMLGFIFSKDPTVASQIQNIVRKANKRYFILLKYKKYGINKDRLRDVYTSILRSVLEYSAPAYHSQLTKAQTNLLEKVQKRCLRLIYGYEKTYEDLLVEARLETLESRRTVLFNKFAAKTVKNQKYSAWFPPKPETRPTRSSQKYLEEHASGNRLYNSPIYTMRRTLNSSDNTQQIDLSGFFTVD